MPSCIEMAKDLIEEREGVVTRLRSITDKAWAENKRALTAEEQAEWKRGMNDADKLKERADNLKAQARMESDCRDDEDEDERDDEDEDVENRKKRKRKKREEDEDERDDEDEDEERDDEDEDDEDGKRSLIRLPDGRMAQVVKPGSRRRSRTGPGATKLSNKRQLWENEAQYRTRLRRNSFEYRSAFMHYLLHGRIGGQHARAIAADTDIIGGYLIAPQEFVAKLIKFVDNLVWLRQRATKFVVAEAQTLGAPSLDTDPSNALWTSELATGTQDTAMTFGKRELTPNPLAKRILISNKLLRMAQSMEAFSDGTQGSIGGGAEGLVRQRLGYIFGITEENAFLTGTGAQQPLGLFVASSRGIDTSRDVVTGNSNGFTADGLIAAKYSLKVQYQAKAEWLFHRNALQFIAQLKDANGQYLWSPANRQPVQEGYTNDTLLGRPVMSSEYVPNVYTTGQYVGMLGDYSFVWIADSINLQIQRLVELYAESNQTGFIARQELDAMPVLAEAFARLKCN